MSNNRHRGPMGPGPAVAEKPKDFKKALGKLYGFIKPFIVPIIVALFSPSRAPCSISSVPTNWAI